MQRVEQWVFGLTLGLHGLSLGKTATSSCPLALLVAGLGQGGAPGHALKGIATAVGVVHRAFGVGHGQRDMAQAQLQPGKIAVDGSSIFPGFLFYPHLRPSLHRFQCLRLPAQGAQTEGRFVEQPGLVAYRQAWRQPLPGFCEETGHRPQISAEGAELLPTVEAA